MTEAPMTKGPQTGVPGSDGSHTTQYLTFRIAGETYGVSILQVREILRFETITAVPSTPSSIRGVINLRGSVVPVVDLAVKFGLPESEISKWSCIVIVEVDLDGEQAVMGVMADAVSQVVEFMPEDIEPPPPFGSRVAAEYLVGLGRAEPKFVLILDLDSVLTAAETTLVTDGPADGMGAVEAQKSDPGGQDAEPGT